MVSPVTAVLQRGILRALRLGRFDEARTLLDRLSEVDPVSVETRGLHCELLLRSGNPGEALRLGKELLRTFPASPRVHLLVGQAHFRLKDYAKALPHFEESQLLAPSPSSERWLGKTLACSGRLKEAEAVLNRLKDSDPHVLPDLAFVYERQGRLTDAIALCDSFLTLVPDSLFVRDLRQRLQAREMAPAELQTEVEDLQAVGEKTPPHLIPGYLMSLFSTGQGDRARRFFEEVRSELEPRLLLRIAWDLYKSGTLDLAFEAFLQVVADGANDPKVFSALESTATRIDRNSDLLAFYRRMAEGTPRFHGRARALARRIGKTGTE